MNHYLYKLGTQLSDIRKLLDWSQDELAKKIGVSRPTIIHLEKDPAKMSKNIALALMAVVIYEVGERASHIHLTRFEQWDDPAKRELFILDLKKYGGINSALIGLTYTLPPVGVALTALRAVTSLFAKPAQASAAQEINADKVKEIVNHTISSLQQKLSEHFFLKTLNLAEFIRTIEENEDVVDAIVDDDRL